MTSENSVFSSINADQVKNDLNLKSSLNYLDVLDPTYLNLLNADYSYRQQYLDWLVKNQSMVQSPPEFNPMFFDYSQNNSVLSPTYQVSGLPTNSDLIGTPYEHADETILGLIELMNSNPQLKNKYKITSLYRANAKTPQGLDSFHAFGKAMDIIPVGTSFAELEKIIMQDRQLVDYMRRNNIGILDEYTENGYQARTGATGNHMHFGPDKNALKFMRTLLNKYGYGEN